MADVITRLKVDSTEYDSKIKRATQGLLAMEQSFRKAGTGLDVLLKDEREFVASLGRMETVSKTARGSLRELTDAYTELSIQYKRLTDEEKKGDYGKALSSSLDQLRTRIQQSKKDLADVTKELDVLDDAMEKSKVSGIDFGAVISSLGSQLGISSNMMKLLTSETIAATAAVTAGAAAAAYAAKEWADYNDQFNRQQSMTTTITGLKDGDAEDLTIGARALANTYDVDFRQAIEAANTLIQQFGVSGEQALQLLQDGMQGMIFGDGGKLLSMIQQYAPAFRDAGIEASQLVAIIQNSEGGLFTDENMNAIVMGIRNIRQMKTATSDALQKIGVDAEAMSKKLNDGTMSIFDALREVSGAIDKVESGSQAAGDVMQTVFGRQGTMAGTKLGEAIATLNLNLEETKTQTGELGESFVRLNEANVRLENTMKEIFGLSGWEDMNNLLKEDLANTLSDILEVIGKIKTALGDVKSVWNDFIDRISGNKLQPKTPSTPQQPRQQDASVQWQFGHQPWQPMQQPKATAAPVQQAPENSFRVTTDNRGKVVKATSVVNGKETDVTATYIKEQEKRLKAEIEQQKKALKDANKPKTSTTKITPKQEVKLPDGSVAALEKQLSDLQKAQKLATDTKGWKDYDAQINVVKEKIAALKGELPKDKVATFRIDALTDDARKALESIQGVHIEEKKVEVTADTQQAEKAIQAIPKQKDVEVDVLPGDVSLPNIPTNDKTIKVNVEEGDVTLPNIPTDDKTIKVNVEEGDVSLPDIPTDETVEVTVIADTQEAYDQIKALYPDAPIELKVKVKADTTDLTKLTNTNISGKISELQKQTNTSEWGSNEYEKAKSNLADATAFKNLFEKAVKTGIDTADIDQSALWQKIAGGVDIDDAVWQELIDRINEKLAESDIAPIKIDFETGGLENVSKSVKDLSKSSQVTAQVVGSIGRAFNEIEDPAAKVAGTIAEAIAQVALGYGQALAQSSSLGPWGWIAFAATGMATMISSINAIKSNTKGFATGGIVPGNSFNDQLRTSDYGISSGELILNKAQQGNLASQLTGEERGTQSGTPYVDGEKIFLGINNFLRRSGRGEIVTSR